MALIVPSTISMDVARQRRKELRADAERQRVLREGAEPAPVRPASARDGEALRTPAHPQRRRVLHPADM